MSDYNNDIDMDGVENDAAKDFPLPCPTDSPALLMRLAVVWVLRGVAFDMHEMLDVHRLFESRWDAEDRLEIGLRLVLAVGWITAADILWQQYEGESSM
jgi:hypothetical protein